MPARAPVLTRPHALELAADHGFAASSDGPTGCTGLEVEWLTVSLDDPSRAAPFADVTAALDDVELPNHSRITFEPGGQVEISTAPFPALEACAALEVDALVLGDTLARRGVGLVALGLEPGARRRRVLRTPRYDAMEAHYDARGPAGRTMMRSTAALQVNVGLGDDCDARWDAAHAIGPVLAAAFANSPFGDARPSGWRSTRLAVWAGIGGTRGASETGRTCREAWADHALAAPVMLVRTSETDHVPVLRRLSFGEWVDEGSEHGWPTGDDLAYHLTTLFPPVRPRGWLEIRVIDSVPAPWPRVATAVTAALVDAWAVDPRLASVVAPVRDRWDSAARHGLADPCIADAALACFAVARDHLAGTADAETVAALDEYVTRYVRRGRCPADDLLDAWQGSGRVVPAPENRPAPVWARA